MPATLKSQSDAFSPAGWTFLTNHAHVLLCLVGAPEARMREVAVRVGITERAVQRIVAELEEAGYLSRMREGRANRYIVHEDLFLRHPVESHCTIAELIGMVTGRRERSRPSRKSARRA
jgi:DNA-binding transcriptional ArsR family regulator